MSNSYTVVTASAGSGKTYRLVQNILMTCLRFPDNPQSISHVLALTFTNKAANEMKERILAWLKAFSAENYQESGELMNIRKEFEKEKIYIDLAELHARSKKLLDYVLHHYSTLNIGTIDKFNSRLVRSFSNELGLAQNFSLEIQAEPFLLEAVDKMLEKVGSDGQITGSLLDFVTYNLDNNERVNVRDTLYSSAKEYIKDIHYDHLRNNKDFDWQRYDELKKKLRAEIQELKKEAKIQAAEAIAIIKDNDIAGEDFAGGHRQSVLYFFEKFLATGSPALQPDATEEEKKIGNYSKGSSKTGKPKHEAILQIMPQLLEKRKEIIQKYVLWRRKEKILSSLLPLKVNKDLQDELAKIEEENDLVLLPKFNVLINENLKDEPSAFIYEKVGTQFTHYFFDEFQDTSELQWRNFIPLRNNAITSDNTSFTIVGDPKQSIYRFRGGESRLMMDILNREENSPKKAEKIVLEDNWRSAKNIVEFNNRLYEYHAEKLQDSHKNIFGKDGLQNTKSKDEDGRVKISLIENGKKEDFFNDAADRMAKDIEECLANGFSFKDITILCRRKDAIFAFSQKLQQRKILVGGKIVNIPTISEDGLTLEISHTLNALISYLRWEENKKNRTPLVNAAYHLGKLGRIQIGDFTVQMHEMLGTPNDAALADFWLNNFGVSFSSARAPQLNLYNSAEQLLQEFSVGGRETDFVLNFLEMLYNFTQNAGATLKDFLKFWEEEGSKKTILASENTDAVQIMTIHKAKGLEFPIVFLPMPNEGRARKPSDWFKVSEEGLHSVNTELFEAELATYDEEIMAFNAENEYKDLIDRLCLQYVATTRPVEQLFLYLQKPSKTGSPSEIYQFVTMDHGGNTDEFDLYPHGNFNKKSATKKFEFPTMKIEDLKTQAPDRTSIKIATPSKSYQNRNEKVRRGIFLHEMLSKINAASDIEDVVAKYLAEGEISTAEVGEISDALHKIVAANAEYFSEGVKVLNERDLMTEENGEVKIYRPDRLLKTPEGIKIIDFKTGEEKPEHLAQVERYRRILERFGEKVAEIKLIYI